MRVSEFAESGSLTTRRAALAGVAVAPIALSQSRSRRRPNFLFILADDHAGYVMGCDGNKRALTPNIDRLGREGTRFSSHHCNSPVCTPSRQSLLTGQLPHAAGVTLLATPLASDKPTLARQFRQAKYRTSVFGKMHFNRPGTPGMHGFDTAETEDRIAAAWQATPPRQTVPGEIQTKPRWQPFKDPARIWLNADKLPYPAFGQDMKGTYIAGQATRYMEQQGRNPFALWVSFQEPHSPYDFPIEDRGRFDPAKFPVPPIGPEDPGQVPLIFRDLTDTEKQGIVAAYYTSVSFVDRNVGRVLEALRRLRLEDDTFVIYTADHGYCLGQHGRFEKHCGYEPALRIPLIMRYPGRIRRGVVSDMTEHVDVSATIPDMMGLDPLPVRHGQSLRPYLEGRSMAKPRDHVFSEYAENEEAYIKTRDWKYIFCSGKRARLDGYQTDHPTPGRYKRLYSLKNDPGEFTDVARTNPETVARLETLMLDRFRATHPDANSEPTNLSREDAMEYYLRPRDGQTG
jgi:choline-sulfatase